MGGVGQILMFDYWVGGWGWQDAYVRNKKNLLKIQNISTQRKRLDKFTNFVPIIFANF